ncbi:hypothetical protein BO223_09750 [Faecalibaculum rodentium]|uniref:Uncharacterized protein n=1 Tax=Faecalibaculum rodentium TaxID=1702221 RepID=A0A1Q9YIH0_9FIRM|nr:hypothetical protein BO223_09750 [Faecalibaculum rodentium]
MNGYRFSSIHRFYHTCCRTLLRTAVDRQGNAALSAADCSMPAGHEKACPAGPAGSVRQAV